MYIKREKLLFFRIIQKSNENRVSRSEVTAKTRALVKKILISETSTSRLTRIRDLSEHIMQFPPTRMIAAQEQKLIAELLEMVIYGSNDNLKEEARQCLTLIGVHPSPKGKGLDLLKLFKNNLSLRSPCSFNRWRWYTWNDGSRSS